MLLEIKKRAEDVTIEIVGRLDEITAPVLDKTIRTSVARRQSLTLDLKELEYISGEGQRVILNAATEMREVGSMKLTGVSASMMEVFQMTDFTDVLTIE